MGRELTLEELRRHLEAIHDRLGDSESAHVKAMRAFESLTAPVPMRLVCPACGNLHIDEGEFATKPHHTHACQHCGEVWRPAVVATVGVRFLPGFRNEDTNA